VDFWERGKYSNPDDVGPDALIAASDISGQVARCTAKFGGREVWITRGMSKSGQNL